MTRQLTAAEALCDGGFLDEAASIAAFHEALHIPRVTLQRPGPQLPKPLDRDMLLRLAAPAYRDRRQRRSFPLSGEVEMRPASIGSQAVVDRSTSGFSLVELVLVVAIVSILAVMAIPSYNTLRGRFFNTTAMTDVLNVGKALEGLEPKDTRMISVKMTGPGEVKNLPGPRISRRTAITVSRSVSRSGEVTYAVQGNHLDGGTIYFFQAGRLFAKGDTR